MKTQKYIVDSKNGMTPCATESTLAAAITRSITHTEIVRVECENPAGLAGWIADNYDEVDAARENDGDLDLWGKRSGQDFRLRIGAIR